jgi:hypothetical protein
LVEKRCVSASRWVAEFWITAEGGNGTYTFYRDIDRIHGPAAAAAYGYVLEFGASSPAVGTFSVESGDQRAEESFWVAHPNCSSFAFCGRIRVLGHNTIAAFVVTVVGGGKWRGEIAADRCP